ncbi:MAG: GTPase Era [Candidatus Omnitrophica bacterium]|nr:GTPase Era [Candidatus Omnitrophota bacterium]MCM8793328.1 GTPase Era [Candidatus Omnitrophota bacterium]
MPKKCGFVAIMGRPNVGKSTLLNTILGEKVSIVSPKPQTTRFQIRGILNEERGQIIFVDTPGMHIPKTELGKYLNVTALKAKTDCDLILYMVDLTRPPGEEEKNIIRNLSTIDKPVIMVLNKQDKGTGFVNEYIKFWQENMRRENDPLKYYIPVSALEGKNIPQLLEVIFSLLPESQPFYPEDILSDFPLRLNISEIIREKILNTLKEELPYSTAVMVEEMLPRREDLLYIKAIILVERESQKGIVVGKKGEMIKKIGERARKEIETLLEKKVYLELFVKVEKNWQENPLILKKLGYYI